MKKLKQTQNVYIPADLARAMALRPDINWSLLAQQAWRKKLAERDWLLVASEDAP